jgi:hypothetical protein
MIVSTPQPTGMKPLGSGCARHDTLKTARTTRRANTGNVFRIVIDFFAAR